MIRQSQFDEGNCTERQRRLLAETMIAGQREPDLKEEQSVSRRDQCLAVHREIPSLDGVLLETAGARTARASSRVARTRQRSDHPPQIGAILRIHDWSLRTLAGAAQV